MIEYNFNRQDLMDKIDLKILGLKFLLAVVTITYGIMIMNLKSRVSELEEINKSIYTYNSEGIYEVYDIPQIIAILKGSDSNG